MTAFVLAGLQFGDEGKGSWTDHLTRKEKSSLTVRYSGGPQCAHNVVCEDGTHHTFAQFGSGTFAGARTLLSKGAVIDPLAFLRERKVLGNKTLLQNVYVEDSCLISTPFHAALNRALEIMRGNNKHGSCGMGVGTTRKLDEEYDIRVTPRDIQKGGQHLLNKLKAVSEECFKLLFATPPSDQFDVKRLREEMRYFYVNLQKLVNSYIEWGKKVNIIDHDLILAVVQCSRNPIFEGAQGVLLDQVYGFYPYVTRGDITQKGALDILNEIGFKDIIKLGIMRPYMTRHGAGPLPTEVRGLTIPGDHNSQNEWQGHFRAGVLDIEMMKHALWANPVDGLLVSCVDHLINKRLLCACLNYDNIRRAVEAIRGVCGNPLSEPSKERRRIGSEALMGSYMDIAKFCEFGDRFEMLEFLKEYLAPIFGESGGPVHLDKRLKN